MRKKIKLKSILKELKKIPSDEQFLESLRQGLVDYIRTNPVVAKEPYAKKFGFKAKIAPTAVLIGMIIVLSGAGTVAASQDSLPGETLYSIKLLSERARVAIALTPEKKADLQMSLAQERIKEAKNFVEKIKSKQLTLQEQETALDNSANSFNDNLDGVYNWAGELKRQGRFDDAIQINSSLKTAVGIYRQILDRNLDEAMYKEEKKIKNINFIDVWKDRASDEIDEIEEKEFSGARLTGLENSVQNKINAVSKKVENIEKLIEKKNLNSEAQKLSQQKLKDTKKVLQDAKSDYDKGDYEDAFEKAQGLIKSLSGAKALLEISSQIDVNNINNFWNGKDEKDDDSEDQQSPGVKNNTRRDKGQNSDFDNSGQKTENRENERD